MIIVLDELSSQKYLQSVPALVEWGKKGFKIQKINQFNHSACEVIGREAFSIRFFVLTHSMIVPFFYTCLADLIVSILWMNTV